MKKEFTETKFYSILELVGNLITLNFLFVVTSLPILSIGASVTALYKAVGSDKSVRTYFSAFKNNWKQSTVVWLIISVLIDLAMFNGLLVFGKNATPSVLKVVAFVFSTLLAGLLFSWVFQLIALFDNSIKETMKNSVMLGLANLPVTFVAICLNLIFPLGLVFFTTKFLQFGWVWLGFGFSIVAFVCTKLLRHAIQQSTGVLFEVEDQDE